MNPLGYSTYDGSDDQQSTMYSDINVEFEKRLKLYNIIESINNNQIVLEEQKELSSFEKKILKIQNELSEFDIIKKISDLEMLENELKELESNKKNLLEKEEKFVESINLIVIFSHDNSELLNEQKEKFLLTSSGDIKKITSDINSNTEKSFEIKKEIDSIVKMFKIINVNNSKCNLCLDNNLDNQILSCGHTNFCGKCIKTIKKCPMCRKDATIFKIYNN